MCRHPHHRQEKQLHHNTQRGGTCTTRQLTNITHLSTKSNLFWQHPGPKVDLFREPWGRGCWKKYEMCKASWTRSGVSASNSIPFSSHTWYHTSAVAYLRCGHEWWPRSNSNIFFATFVLMFRVRYHVGSVANSWFSTVPGSSTICSIQVRTHLRMRRGASTRSGRRADDIWRHLVGEPFLIFSLGTMARPFGSGQDERMTC